MNTPRKESAEEFTHRIYSEDVKDKIYLFKRKMDDLRGVLIWLGIALIFVILAECSNLTHHKSHEMPDQDPGYMIP